MEFDVNRPIYLQIADSICNCILSGETAEGDRIPSVREYGAQIGVNPNTVMRSFERLTDMGVIHNKRGIGYFISDNAREIVLEKARKDFIGQELPKFIERANLLGLDIKQLLKNQTI